MDEEAFEAITATVLARAEAGDLDACERLLIDQLAQVRGDDVEQELRTLSNLAAIYNRSGRRVESLILAQRGVQLARAAGNAYREARGLTGVCNGRHGLRIGADIGAELERLRELMVAFPVREDTLLLNVEVASLEFVYAMHQGRADAARIHMERFRELAAKLPRDRALTDCVYAAGLTEIALHEGDAARAQALLDDIHRREVAAPFHMPELSVRRVEASIAARDLAAARREAHAAFEAIRNAPPIARAECIHFGVRLADALAGPLDDVESARRTYDLVAAAVFERIQQVDACTKALPELGMPIGDYEKDLVRHRKSFVSQQKAVMERVAAMFRGQRASSLQPFLVSEDTDDLFAICAWCESARGADGRWIPVGHLVPREGFQITHGICPRCAAAM